MSTSGEVPVGLSFRFGRDRGEWSFVALHGLIFVLISVAVIGVSLSVGAVSPLAFPIPAAIAILVLGVPHGAFDVALARNRWDLRTPARVALFLVAYVGLAGAVLVIWILVPAVALPTFLLVSGYHFAGDWERQIDRLPRLFVGLAIIMAPAVFHGAEVSQIFSWIVPEPIARTLPTVMAGVAIPALLCAGLSLAVLCRAHPMAAMEASAVIALSLLSAPLCFFIIYFCGFHSVRHMERAYRELRPKSLMTFFRLSLPYAPLAILGTVLGSWGFVLMEVNSSLLGTVFISLAALTAPHMSLVDSRISRL